MGTPEHESWRPPVTLSKLVPPPPLPGAIRRPELLERLAGDGRVTLVVAPPGYGKTVAVRQWMETTDRPTAWMSVDLIDQSPHVFWVHFVTGLRQTLPNIDVEVDLLLEDRGPDQVFLAALGGEVARHGLPVTFVLDGVSHLDDSEVFGGIAHLVEQAGHLLRLVIVSRSRPPLPVSAWRTKGWVIEVTEAQLRFGDDEALTLARETAATRERSTVLALSERLEGWPMGVHVGLLSGGALQNGDGDGDGAAEAGRDADRVLADYVVSEVLDRLPRDLRDVALGIAVPRWLDPSFCHDLLGEDAVPLLAELVRRGMFLQWLDEARGALAFHRLVRQVLLRELRSRDPDAHERLHRRAATLWMNRGDVAEAHLHLMALGDVQAANALIIAPTFALLDRGDAAGVSGLLTSLPPVRDVDDPSLALDLSIASFFGRRRDEAWQWLDLAATLGAEECEDTTVILRFTAVSGLLSLMDGDPATAAEHDDRYYSLPSAPRTRIDPVTNWFPVVSARIALSLGRRARARTAIDAARAIDLPPTIAMVTLPALEAWLQLELGHLRPAAALAAAAHEWSVERDVRLHHGVLDAMVVDGWCRVGQGDLARASEIAEAALEYAGTLGFPWDLARTGALQAEVERLRRGPTAALHLIGELRRSIDPRPTSFAASLLDVVEAAAMIHDGRIDDAAPIVERLADCPHRRLLAARAELSRNGGSASRELADEMLAGRLRWPVQHRLEAELLLATAASSDAQAETLGRILTAGADTGWVSPFLGHDGRVSRLLDRAPVEQLHPELHRALQLAPARPDHRAVQVEPLTARELSLLELLPTHLSYAQIGARTYLSVNTVKSNLKGLYRKLGVGSRADAVEVAERAGLL